MIALRNDGRRFDQIRPLKITFNIFGYADTSVLFELGGTKVLVGVTLQEGVPRFLKGRGTGWLTAEYALLPISTRGRSSRGTNTGKPNSRSIEISRIIGRSLRSVVDLSLLGERTIIVDCDVLQADGGTRCACISAASVALRVASEKWMSEGIINGFKPSAKRKFLSVPIAAISVGIVDSCAYLDLSQREDNKAEVDFNFVLSESGDVVEIQGTSEKRPISWENFDLLKKLALEGVAQIFGAYDFSKFPIAESLDSSFSIGDRQVNSIKKKHFISGLNPSTTKSSV